MLSVLRFNFRPGLALLAGVALSLAGSCMAQAQDASAPVAATEASAPAETAPAAATAEAPAAEAAAPAAPPTAEEVLSKLTVGIDTIWVLVCSMLVFFMNLGFGCVESGFCRAKNCVNILSKNFVVFAVCSIGFWLIGWEIGRAHV